MRYLALAGMAAVLITSGAVERQDVETRAGWEPVGLSGGGAMLTPAISPIDPNRMMVNCDMSAAYISADGGRTWRMIHHAHLRSSTRCRPAFHPRDPNTVFAADGWRGLKVSRDGGATWQPIGNLPGDLRGEIAMDPTMPARMLVGAGEGVWHSLDAGQTWTKAEGPHGEVVGFAFQRPVRSASAAPCFAATSEGVWLSGDQGRTWSRMTDGLPSGRLLAFAGAASEKDGLYLYASVERREENGRSVGGIFRLTSASPTWEPAMGPGLNVEAKAFDEWAMGPVAQYRRLATSDADPRRVYAFNTNTGIPPPHHASVYRSDDAGKTWRATFQADPRFPGLNVEPDYTVCEDGQFYQDVSSVAACATDPDRLLLTDTGRCLVTDDGGKTWRNGHTRLAPGEKAQKQARWLCTGLVVTTTWNYYADPFRPERHYICYTDIGFAHSDDRGRTWRWWALEGRAPWRNTCYELAFDPDTPGKVWGAFSNVHDIPNDNIISGRHNSRGPGGVCVSIDHAATWKATNAGLPVAPVTSVVVDPRSPKGRRTLYAGLFGQGVYKSNDDGRTWTERNHGLGAPENMRVSRVFLHRDGTLFALVTALRRDGKFQPEGVGLYASKDGAETWNPINRSQPLLWPKDFTVDPRDSRTIYLGASDAGGKEEGGLWRTTDGGATWRRIGRQGPETFGGYLHPTRPGWIYMTLTEGAPGAGLWLSRDGGATWKPVEGLPFVNAQRVHFDPRDPGRLVVTTFGGSVWRGPAETP